MTNILAWVEVFGYAQKRKKRRALVQCGYRISPPIPWVVPRGSQQRWITSRSLIVSTACITTSGSTDRPTISLILTSGDKRHYQPTIKSLNTTKNALPIWKKRKQKTLTSLPCTIRRAISGGTKKTTNLPI